MREGEGIRDRLLVSVEEAAEMLSLGRSLVYGLIMAGKIHSLKIGRARRIPVGELERFIAREMEAEGLPDRAGGPQ